MVGLLGLLEPVSWWGCLGCWSQGRGEVAWVAGTRVVVGLLGLLELGRWWGCLGCWSQGSGGVLGLLG